MQWFNLRLTALPLYSYVEQLAQTVSNSCRRMNLHISYVKNNHVYLTVLLQRNTHNIHSKPSAHKYKMLITKIYNGSILSVLRRNCDQFELPVEQYSPYLRQHSQLPLLCPSGWCIKWCLFSVSV